MLPENLPGLTVCCFYFSRPAATSLKADTCFARQKQWSMPVCPQRMGHLVAEVECDSLTQGKTIGNKRGIWMPAILRDLAAEMYELPPALFSQNILSKPTYPKVIT